MIVKIKYKNVNPKNNFMKDYLNYIENGGKLTLETKEILFKESYEDFFISHYEKDEDNFAEDFSDDFVEEYSNYIEHRNGSQVLFSSDGLDIQSIKESFKNKKTGVIHYPIISLKEDETIEYQFTREVMIEKGKEIAVMFKQELNISDYDFEWICAYHEKPEEKRNESAGTMPHLHFMIYSGAQSNGYHNLSVIEKLRKKSIDIFYREHKQELIVELLINIRSNFKLFSSKISTKTTFSNLDYKLKSRKQQLKFSLNIDK